MKTEKFTATQIFFPQSQNPRKNSLGKISREINSFVHTLFSENVAFTKFLAKNISKSKCPQFRHCEVLCAFQSYFHEFFINVAKKIVRVSWKNCRNYLAQNCAKCRISIFPEAIITINKSSIYKIVIQFHESDLKFTIN